MASVTRWTVWGVEASLVVDNAAAVADAERLVRMVVEHIDQACSRFRPDSELMRLQAAGAGESEVSPVLAFLVGRALESARITRGDVDPTVGTDLEVLGYDRDLAEVRLGPAASAVPARAVRRTPGWRLVGLRGRTLTVPDGVHLDLGATAKAVAADWAAGLVRDELHCGVMVSLGGDLATAGTGPEGGWQILVEDLPGDPWQQVSLRAGQAMATSSTQKRRWNQGGRELHHILDPRFGQPVEPVWRSVTVASSSCLEANTWSTAGVVRGHGAVQSFEQLGIAARLVDRFGRVVTTAGWPEPPMIGQAPHG